MRTSWITFVALAVLLTVDVASACPMCKVAAESDPKLPKAFMLSILFMLAMPFTLASCFGVAFYRLSQKMPKDVADQAAPGEGASDSEVSSGTGRPTS